MAIDKHQQTNSKATTQQLIDHETFLQSELSHSLEHLAGVLESERATVFVPSQQPLVSALQWVLHHMQYTLADDVLRQLNAQHQTIEHLARRAQLFSRKVRLTADWWQHSYGPLLGFYGEDHQPCALIPTQRGGYRLIDEDTHKEVTVTQAIADTIDPTAWMFYTALPHTKLRIHDVWQHAKRFYKSDMTIFFTTMMFSALFTLASPIIIGWIFDPIVQDALTNQLFTAMIALAFIALSVGLFSFVQGLTILRLEGKMGLVAQAAIWDRVLKLPVGFFSRFQVGDLVFRAQGIDSMRSIISSALSQVSISSLTGVLAFGLMLYYNWKLALIVLALSLLYLFITYRLGKLMLMSATSIQEARSRLASLVFQLLSMVPKIRVAGAERSAFAQWAAHYRDLMHSTYHLNKLTNISAIIQNVFNNVGLLIIFLVIALEGHQLFAFFEQPKDLSTIVEGSLQSVIPVNHFISFNIAYGLFTGSIIGLVNVAIQLLSLKPLIKRLMPILEQVPEPTGGMLTPKVLQGHVHINQLGFRYDANRPWVLTDVNLEIKAGEFVGIVGSSGSGKSTLLRLLIGFENPTTGSIYLDNQSLNNLNMQEIRQFLGVVLQNSMIMAGTIFDNVAAGLPLEEDAIWAALRAADLHQDVAAMPMKLDTLVSEGATTLSGGQKQRLMIARAVARDPRILIFDEATSALDNVTQAQVTTNLAQLKCTRIVVAHRHTAVVDADNIIVIHQGSIVEMGTYQALMDKKSYFYQLTKQ